MKAKAIIQAAGAVATPQQPRRVFGTRPKKKKVAKRDIYRGGIKRHLESSSLPDDARAMIQSYYRGRLVAPGSWRAFCANPACSCAFCVDSYDKAMDLNLRCADCNAEQPV